RELADAVAQQLFVVGQMREGNGGVPASRRVLSSEVGMVSSGLRMKEQGLAGRAVVVTSRVALASALVAALLWASPAAQQQPPPTEPAAPAPAADDQEAPEPQPTFRTGINFVSVDAIITDRQGNPVDDLTQDDFEVLE